MTESLAFSDADLNSNVFVRLPVLQVATRSSSTTGRSRKGLYCDDNSVVIGADKADSHRFPLGCANVFAGIDLSKAASVTACSTCAEANRHSERWDAIMQTL
jgi:hypothetical protein